MRPYERVPCLLDAPFGVGPVECPPPGAEEYFITGGYGYTYVLEPDTLRDVTFKEFDSLPTVTGLVGGVGVIYTIDTNNSFEVEELVYARIGGEEVGTQVFTFPTADEPGPLSSPSAAGITALYPNPVRERLTLTFRTAEPATVEVIDVLGRVVRRQEVEWRGSEQGVLHIDVRGLRTGAYLVRVRTESGGSVTPEGDQVVGGVVVTPGGMVTKRARRLGAGYLPVCRAGRPLRCVLINKPPRVRV